MTTAMENLEPKAVFRYFSDICAIPHGSGNEGGVADYLCRFAEAHGLYYRRDDMNNVLIVKEATSGYEDAPCVMLQGHTDMVCQKRADKVHDFTRDPLTLKLSPDGWLSADGTTLGADDGIAVAIMLAVLEGGAPVHPRLECLFTVQEETGLCGAEGFDYSDIRAKLLINIDSETDGVGTVSCAGGARIDMSRPVTFARAVKATATVAVSGLKGGHSGAEIHMPRGNAHRLVGQILSALYEAHPFTLVSVAGGNMDNAIPRDCTAVIAYDAADTALPEALSAICAAQEGILSGADRATGHITPSFGASDTVSSMTEEDTEAILGLLMLTPCGVATMCEDMPSLVESSCNMGILYTTEQSVEFGFLARSSVEERKADIRRKLAVCARLCGAEIRYVSAYPGWAYDKSSPAEQRYTAVYEELFGKKPVIEAIHAGLECGLITHAIPGLGAISIGPDMVDIHTPEERVGVASVERVYQTVLRMLAVRE